MQSRRNFIGKVATGLAGAFAGLNVLGANDRVRLGIIGPGDRGTQILREAIRLPEYRTRRRRRRLHPPPRRCRTRSRPPPRRISTIAICSKTNPSTPS